MIGVGSAGSVALLEREAEGPQRARLPFGIGLLDWALDRHPELLDVTLAGSPVLVSVSFGDAWAWGERVRAAGIVTATQIASVDEARMAEDAGIQVLVARGSEGGGHGDPKVGTLPLLEAVLDAVSVPVLAAGGISSPRGLAAVLAAGASGAWMGTAFSACPESLASDTVRDALVGAKETETVTTSVFDISLGYGWPARFPERVLHNPFSEHWSGREADLALDPEARAALADAITAGDRRAVHVDAGQGVGSLTEVRSVAEVMERLFAGAKELLGTWAP